MRKTVLPASLLMLAAALSATPARAQNNNGCVVNRGASFMIVGLTSDQRLICFREDNPAAATNLGRLSGLTGDTRLVGIDFRPATGELYGVGNAGGIYVLDLRDGSATFRAQLNAPLTGTSFGIDFNPAVDRLRIVSDSGQNLRVNVSDGAVTADTNLSNPDPATGITGAAYTNNDADSNTGTTLFGLDTRNDQIVIQAPPNAGSLSATGKLMVDAGSDAGFDIFSRIKGGTTIGVHAFASLVTNGRARFYKIDLLSGRAWPRGAFRAQDQVVDIAIPLNQVPRSNN